MNDKILNFFKNGGIFLFDENDSKSENTYYLVEELMGEEEGANIVETEVENNDQICLFYDDSVLDEETVKNKYFSGEYVKHI